MRAVQVYCALQPTIGSIRFPARSHCSVSTSPCFQDDFNSVQRSRAFPTDALPFEAFPSLVAVPRHRGRFPLVVQLAAAVPVNLSPKLFPASTTASGASASVRRPQGFAPPMSPLPPCRVASAEGLDAPLGLSLPILFHKSARWPLCFRACSGLLHVKDRVPKNPISR